MSEEIENPQSPPVFRKYVRFGMQGVVLGMLATAAVFFFTVEPDTWTHLSDFNWFYAPILIGGIFTAWLCNGGRIWINSRALDHKLKYRQAISISLSTEFGIAASPAGMGGTAIRLYLLKKAQVPLTTGASMLAADVVVDLAFFALITPVAIFFILRDENWTAMFSEIAAWQMAVAAGAVVGGMAIMVLFFQTGWWAKVIHTIANATPYGRKKRWSSKFRFLRWELRRSFRRTWLITHFLFRKRKGSLFINFCLATVQWTCRYGALPLILLAFDSSRNPFPLLFLQGFLFLFAMLVFLPGGGGGVEVATALILSYFVATPIIPLVLLFWRFATYYLYLIGGGSVFFYVCSHMNSLFPEKPSSPNPL